MFVDHHRIFSLSIKFTINIYIYNYVHIHILLHWIIQEVNWIIQVVLAAYKCPRYKFIGYTLRCEGMLLPSY